MPKSSMAILTPSRAQRRQRLERRVRIDQQHRFGDLELQIVERHADHPGDFLDALGERGIAELHARKVDARS